MAVVILVLIEINERIKAKKNVPKNCTEEHQACSDCSLAELCDKEEKKTSHKP